MSGLINRLTTRTTRAAIQVAAAVMILVAVGVALIDHTATRALSTALIGVVALLGVKLGLIASIAAKRSLVGVEANSQLNAQMEDLTRQVDHFRPQVREATAELTRIASETSGLSAEMEPMSMLIRRTEASIAEFSTLRHEVTYLRETVDRLARPGDLP